MPPSLRRTLVVAILALVVAGALVWSFWPRPVPVETAEVTRGPMAVEVSDNGRTRVREIYRLSAPVSGRLLRVEVHAGDSVIGGQTRVAELQPIPPNFLDVRTRAQATAAVDAAQAAQTLAAAEVRRQRAQLEFATSDYGRFLALARISVTSRADLERAKLARDTAAAALASAEAALKVKQSDLAAARALLIDPGNPGNPSDQATRDSIPLIAPVSGCVLRVASESEATLPAGALIMEVGDPRKMEVVAELVSQDAVQVHAGDRATITDWGGPTPLAARVRRVEPSGFTKISALGVEEQRVNVLLDPAGTAEAWAALADGFRVVVHIVVWSHPDAIRVPVSALFRQGDGWATFVLRNRRAVRTAISAGHASDEVAEVLAGLRPGDRVIVHPSDRVRDGVRVSVEAATAK
ncbi:MAG TPA: HlyD family efflux transporter periplasmic adaptor subunit [Rhodanobacteraceae bacterium]|nr:HlyD family efflux transporter periplasmic adaptor subunit [Rhodanobacteraceae bacterium]